ncbi:hypothetical protein FQN60_014918 [Etheostoma spectabile]|uniref:Death domain-containing protein n=1 Tax=Etheostoma spectabile TaxID=54343 RepID=A0A5J5CT98_9PERO|nr:hypothetical protein FQN60_014918 [Etheostoma spectabile]
MIAAESSKFPAWFSVVTLVLLFLLKSAASSTNEGQNISQSCVDGTYEHEGKKCCLCGAGLHLEEHCTVNLQIGKCKTCLKETYSSHPNNHESCEPCTSCSQPNVVDLQAHLPDIVEVIGWKVMKDLAMRSTITDPTIEACQMNHPGNIQEATLELLKIWVEKNGKEASRNLVQILHKSGKKDRAERVMDILSRPNNNHA